MCGRVKNTDREQMVSERSAVGGRGDRGTGAGRRGAGAAGDVLALDGGEGKMMRIRGS